MEPFGLLTNEIDFTLVLLYTFWIFFAGLVFYLLREGRREGFPLIDDVTGKKVNNGLIWIPGPKKFVTSTGEVHYAPDFTEVEPPVNAVPAAPFPGAPLVPVGNPLTAGVGPGSYAMRHDRPDLNFENEIKIVPMRLLADHDVAEDDADPRGMEVVGADGMPAGIVTDLWIDRAEMMVRYLEVKLPSAGPADAPAPVVEAAPATAPEEDVADVADGDGDVAVAEAAVEAQVTAPAADTILMPMNCATVSALYGQVATPTILGHQFADVPRIKNATEVTLLEEDKIMAYFAAGELYATPERSEPLL